MSSDISERYKKEIEETLKREHWQGYASGKIEGALSVIYQLDVDKQTRIELLKRSVELSEATATRFIEEEDKKCKPKDENAIFWDIRYHVVDITDLQENLP